MKPPSLHPLDMNLDLDAEEFAQVVELISQPSRVIPQLAAAFRRHRRLLRGARA